MCRAKRAGLPGVANGCGSKLNRRGYAGFGPCFHSPGFHFGTGFLSHGQSGNFFNLQLGVVWGVESLRHLLAHFAGAFDRRAGMREGTTLTIQPVVIPTFPIYRTSKLCSTFRF